EGIFTEQGDNNWCVDGAQVIARPLDKLDEVEQIRGFESIFRRPGDRSRNRRRRNSLKSDNQPCAAPDGNRTPKTASLRASRKKSIAQTPRRNGAPRR